MKPDQGRKRVVIESVEPEIDCGRFPIKRTVGEAVTVEADVFTDGHAAVSCVLRYRKVGNSQWDEVPMEHLVNDRWHGAFHVLEIGRYEYTLQGWIDHFKSWRNDLRQKVKAGQDVSGDLVIGSALVQEAGDRASGSAREQLKAWAADLASEDGDLEGRTDLALSQALLELATQHPDRQFAATYERDLGIVVDRERARFSAWYEMFPRSCSSEPGEHGAFKDCEDLLPYVASMGFDVLYFPPIHPIGCTKRKGPNNAPVADPEHPGSPWGIGAEEGGHKAVHPRLGTLQHFGRFVEKAREYDIEVALDIAFQCSPDHPYVEEHPEWFRRRPDGTVQFAENPPKKYEDIYPLNFDTDQWPALWEELKSIIDFWIDQGVRIFRVDNPHTKPFRFWEWLIDDVKERHPEVILLSEAFTRPKVMYRLAKLGFTQSYTYFAWRNAKWELTEYLKALTQTEVREYFRPNLWPNTPDILTEYLQTGGRPAFMARLVLAATLGANYGIYGPAFELCEDRPREPGSEEYLNSEKYQIREWDLDSPHTLKDFIARVNAIRRENPALQTDRSLRFHSVDNEELICYSKRDGTAGNAILVVVNLDPYHTQSGRVEVSVADLGLDPEQPYQVHDLLGGGRFLWHGSRNYVELAPDVVPAHIFRVRRRVRTEEDFEYYM